MTDAREGRLAGRVTIVTGAARGIGRGIVTGCAREGARVAVLDRDGPGATAAAADLVEQGFEAIAVEVDVASEHAVEEAFTQVERSLGPVDVLVNNAAIEVVEPFLEIDKDTWDRIVDVNLGGVFLCMRAAMRRFVASGRRGRIINIGSQVALKGAERLAHYVAAKAAVHGLARAVAREAAPHGITVNTVAPGPIATDMLAAMPEDWIAAKLAELPLGRFGTIEEIVPMVLLLASDEGGYITGATLNVSGGDVMMD